LSPSGLRGTHFFMNSIKLQTISFFLPFLLLFSACQGKENPEGKIEKQVDTLYVSTGGSVGRMVSIQEFGVLPDNTAAQNKIALQAAIDKAAASGIGLYVTPCENGYKCDAGLVLKKNVSLIGANGPTGRGTAIPSSDGPTGSVFLITDKTKPFLTVESATRISGIQFYYPEQTYNKASDIKSYPPTIQMSSTTGVVEGVTLTDLTFYGEYTAFDFCSSDNALCEQMLFENCHGYPLSGSFIKIDKCYDIPRILHCSVDPSVGKAFGHEFTKSVIDKVLAMKNYSYWICRTDNAVIVDITAKANYGGVCLASSTYGQLTGFNFDCVTVGIYKDGDSSFNRNWEISQGTIVANAGYNISEIHPVYITGQGHTSLLNVNSSAKASDIITSKEQSYDFVYICGSDELLVSMVNCNMRDYSSDFPISITNKKASVRAVNCSDRDGNLFDFAQDGKIEDYPSGTLTMFNDCESAPGWSGSAAVSLDNEKTEGEHSVATKASNIVIFQYEGSGVKACVTKPKGHFLLDLYCSDVSAFNPKAEGAMELTSSGAPDSNECAWMFNTLGLKTGWNSIDVKFEDSINTGGALNLDAVNFFRLYNLSVKQEVTFKIDNMRFYQE